MVVAERELRLGGDLVTSEEYQPYSVVHDVEPVMRIGVDRCPTCGKEVIVSTIDEDGEETTIEEIECCGTYWAVEPEYVQFIDLDEYERNCELDQQVEDLLDEVGELNAELAAV